ncbi:MAG: MATE family efflux transporter [Sphaerochaetaceae bacterium]
MESLRQEKHRLQREIVHLSFPTMSGSLFQAFYDIVDMVFIGMIDQAAVAASTIFITLFWIVEVLNEIVGCSSVSMISQAYGSGNIEKTEHVCQKTFMFKILLACIGAVVMGVLLPWFYHLYSHDSTVIRYGLSYGYIRLIFLPVFFSSYTVNTIFRCTGDARTPMRLLLVASVMNIVLDPLLMFHTIPGTSIPGLGLGIAGAAIATVGSVSFSFVVGFVKLLRGKAPVHLRIKGILKRDKEIDRKLLSIGFPSGLNLLLRNVCTFVVLRLVSGFGTSAIAILGVGTRIYQFFCMPSSGIATGSGIIVGHCLGAERPSEAKLVISLTTLNCLACTVVLSALMWLFPHQLLGIFLGGISVGKDGVSLMHVFALCLLCLALMSGLSAAFYGSGETRAIMYGSLIAQWVFQIPYALIVIKLLHLGISFLWLSYLVGDCTELITLYCFFRSGRWSKKRV